jgi:hypothetical protein
MKDKIKKSVYVLHNTNSGTPESSEIHSIYGAKKDALATMKKVLADDYDSTMAENEDYEYMHISKQTLFI